MRFPGAGGGSRTAQTILGINEQEEERKAKKRASKNDSRQLYVQSAGAGINALSNVGRTVADFKAIDSREDEGAKNRAFEQAMMQARQGFEVEEGSTQRGFTAEQERLNRANALKIAETRSDPVSEALSLLIAERKQNKVASIDADPSIDPAMKDAVANALLTGQRTPETDAVLQRIENAAPLKQAAGQAGFTETADLVGRGEPAAFLGKSRDDIMNLIGQAAVNQGEDSPAVRQIAEKIGYKLPERSMLQSIGRGTKRILEAGPRQAFGNPDLSVGAEEEIQQLLQALQSQYGPTATDRGYTSTKPLSPQARQYILSIRQQLGK